MFRYHRRTTGIQLANPHRFRRTFASDMVRAGMSLPALMQLMGHADIQTTLRYVQVTPHDVYLELCTRGGTAHPSPSHCLLMNRACRPPLQHPLVPVFEHDVDSFSTALSL